MTGAALRLAALFMLSEMDRKTDCNQGNALGKLLAKLACVLEMNFKSQLNHSASITKLKIIPNFKSQVEEAKWVVLRTSLRLLRAATCS